MPQMLLSRSAVTGSRRKASPPRTRTSAVQVIGELILTFGLIALLFVGWELWWTNLTAGASQSAAVEQFARQAPVPTPVNPSVPPLKVGAPDYGTPPALQEPAHGKTFGIIYIPRFGDNYSRPLAEGTSTDVLDTLGLGHYGNTAMPGEAGNFAVAGHRQTHGAVLDNIHTLAPGDKIYIQTKDAFYTYAFRNEEIVLPSRTDVLLPVPTQPGVQPKESLLTMTSCNPRFGAQERIIAYSVLESWQPISAGAPAAIAGQVAALAGRG
ncbi:class E sortase [Arthrobacter sp. H14-L1]|uniref:class E sortase n=1 Tax=Arthrobacter sp. H14-L1 TaxID=2996697 RepID=UPI00226E8E53|nr:class E sortase [Arthrobacter sp. H14-L1]MCY0905470.1 class E sortase [Arthrobacter sp. H14-L1]